MKQRKVKEVRNRRVLQWALAPVVPLVIVGGAFWPWLGLLAAGFMALLLALVWFRGRFYCGWICPMGAFHDRVLAKVSRNLPMLPLFKRAWFRWLVLVLMMALFGLRLAATGGEPEAVGAAFVMMWTLSTGLAVALGLLWRPRSWCRFCPMGTVQGLLAPKRSRIQVAETCRQCGLCQKACPVEINPGAWRESGAVADEACLGCRNCVAACSHRALSAKPASPAPVPGAGGGEATV